MTTTPVTLDGCQVAPSVLIEAPPCDLPRLFGLYSVAKPRPMTDPHLANGARWVPEVTCTPSVESLCPTCTAPGDPKNYSSQPDLRTAVPFVAYGSHECSGITPAQAQRRATANLRTWEEWRTERELSIAMQAEALDLTPLSGAVSLTAGLAALETWAGSNVSCVPMIHVSRGIPAAAPFGAIIRDRDRLATTIGSDVVAGSGYTGNAPDGSPAEPGETYLYVSGPVQVWRGEVIKVTPESALVDTSNNDVRAWAERSMLLGWDCGSAAIAVVIP